MKFIKFLAVFISALVTVSRLTTSFTAAESAETITISALPEKYLDGQETELYRRVLQNVTAIAEGRRFT